MGTLALRDILRDVGATVLGTAAEFTVNRVSTDTRTLDKGSLFVALKGPKFDGHQFLPEAARKGAQAALVEEPLPPDRAGSMVQIRVKNTRLALIELAAAHARRHAARRIAVTGSNGKTTTKDLLRAALSSQGETVASPRSFNNEIGVPLSLLQIDESTRFAAIEVGTSAPGEVAALARMVAPEVGIITNCCAAHLEGLHSVEGVIEEKGSLLDELPESGVAVLNADDAALPVLRARARCPVVTFGVRQPADFRAIDIRFDLRRLTYRIDQDRVFLPLGGCHNVYNSLAAIAAASVLGIRRSAALRQLREWEAPPMRLSLIRTGYLQILDDSYNANPGSVEAAFRTLAAAPVPGRRVVVIGDMKELGERSAELHRAVGEWVSLTEIHLLAAVGRHAEDVREGALRKGLSPERMRVFPSAEAAAAELPALLMERDTVLVKGSRAMAMEQVVEALEKAGRVCVAR